MSFITSAGSQAQLGRRSAPSVPRSLRACADSETHAALCSIGLWLREQGYEFVCPTPETQKRVNARAHNEVAGSLRDVFGWSRPFHNSLLPQWVADALRQVSALQENGNLLRSKLRCSTIGEQFFFHSAFPTRARDAVFFGPDTYRFVALIREALQSPWPHDVRRVVDIGCGSGAGAIAAAQWLDPRVLQDLVLCDINPLALQWAAVNAAINEVDFAHCVQSDALSDVSGLFDLIVSDPPYMIDRERRLYCDGGTRLGIELSMRFLEAALSRLALGGRLVLYTGSPVINGQDSFRLASLPILESAQVRYRYFEIDPDVFGDALDLPEYAAVDRIAVVGLIAHRPGGGR